MAASLRACAVAVLLMTACRTMQPRPDEPAVIVKPTFASHAALEDAVSTALGGAQITVADDALTRDSLLLVERTMRRDANRMPLNGRETAAPERFRLVKVGEQCVLVHERTGRRFVLGATDCSGA